jgi:predicted amidohydrolase
MPSSFTAACIQVNASNDLSANIAKARELSLAAKKAGADMVFMPENVVMMEWGRANILAKAMPAENHLGLIAFQELARELGIWLHAGTLHMLLPGEMAANRTHVIAPDGKIAAVYDKIHMFDVDLGNGESYRESATLKPGNQAVTGDLPWGRLGLSICYDLRFPHLYRALAKAGADFLTIPAAFTRTTGKAHWHVLQRARAIETGCFVISPAQCGRHAGDRETYGHALIVNPWGEVLADAGEEPGFILAKINPAEVAEARRKIPCLTHDRDFHGP